MSIIKYFALALLCLCFTQASGQFASSSDDIGAILANETDPPENNWPSCIVPDISHGTKTVTGKLIFEWANNLNEFERYEYQLSKDRNSILWSKKEVIFHSQIILQDDGDEFEKIRIRKVCYDHTNGLEIFSEWTEIGINNAVVLQNSLMTCDEALSSLFPSYIVGDQICLDPSAIDPNTNFAIDVCQHFDTGFSCTTVSNTPGNLCAPFDPSIPFVLTNPLGVENTKLIFECDSLEFTQSSCPELLYSNLMIDDTTTQVSIIYSENDYSLAQISYASDSNPNPEYLPTGNNMFLIDACGTVNFSVQLSTNDNLPSYSNCSFSFDINCNDCDDIDNDGICDDVDTCVEGTSCDDGQDCTINDQFFEDENGNCLCEGELIDADNDGVCDAEDLCVGGPEPGQTCDDDDPCTVNDTVDENCDCHGISEDLDNDGICDALDDCLEGVTCDDDEACTENDMYVYIDGVCKCQGEEVPDSDNDGYCDEEDNCPSTYNPEQTDDDQNGIGDDCENCIIGDTCNDGDPCTENDVVVSENCDCEGSALPDSDNDGICDTEDNCADIPNEEQTDFDEDGVGDSCDDCIEGASCDDGDICTIEDTYTLIDGNCECIGQVVPDSDGDGLCDEEDNCPDISNPDQTDTDGDGYGDVCEPCDIGEPCDDGEVCTINDVYVLIGSDCECQGTMPEQNDADGDGLCDAIDNCVYTANPDQTDANNNGVGDACEETPDPELLCAFFNAIQATFQNENSFVFSFSGSESTYLDNVYQGLNTSEEQIAAMLAGMGQVNLNFDILVDGQSAAAGGITIFDAETDNYFDPSDWGEYIEGGQAGSQNTISFEIEIIMPDGSSLSCGENTMVIFYENTDEEEEPEEDPFPELEPLNCDSEVDTTQSSNTTPLDDLNVADIFYIYGFPVLVSDVSGSNGVFSGEGVVPIPFQSKFALVEYHQIEINDEHIVTDGTISFVGGSISDIPDFIIDPGTLNFGGEICQEPEDPNMEEGNIDPNTGLDAYGFDANGVHSETETEYDTNGFDVHGNHYETGTEFNEEGCNRDGVDVEGNPCDPSGPGTPPDVQVFADSLNSDGVIENDISVTLNEIKQSLQDSLNTINCGSIRTTLDDAVVTEGLNRAYIFGENDEYLDEGMSEEFLDEPKPMEADIEGRNPAIINIENLHVDLFHCDKTEIQITAALDILEAICQSESLEQLKTYLMDKITNWSSFELSLYEDPADFKDWLLDEIQEYILLNGDDGLEGLFGATLELYKPDIEVLRNEVLDIFDFTNRANYADIASSTEVSFSMSALEQAAFEYEQGFEYIHGHHRAFYVEALGQALNAGGGDDDVQLTPIPIEKEVGNFKYAIYLDDIQVSPTGGKLDAYCLIEDPGTEKKMVFKAEDLNFGPSGLTEESHLHLLTDIELRLNNASMLRLVGGDSTYVSWDCDGFAGMSTKLQIDFCRNFITPLDADLNPVSDPDELYSLDLHLTIPSWLEFTFELDAAPFAITQYEDIKWEITDMIVDMSSSETPDFLIMDGYESPFVSPDSVTLTGAWKGFYMGSLSATLPDEWSNSDDPITVGVNDVLIDDNGVSGEIFAENVIPEGDGNLGGWEFSITDMSVRVLQNHFAGFGLGGQIKVPVLKDGMDYTAVMYPNNHYRFTVNPPESSPMNLFLADAKLDDNTTIAVEIIEGEVLASANLFGSIVIGGAVGSTTIAIPEIGFQGLRVQNQAPYFNPGSWSLPGDVGAKFSGFELTIGDIREYAPEPGNDDLVGLGFDVGLKLNNNVDIDARGGFGIVGYLDVDAKGIQKWDFERIEVHDFCVSGSFEGVKSIAGCINFYRDEPGWGNGFKGGVQVEFDKIDFGFTAVAQFGKMNEDEGDFRYFFVDVMADLGTGITISPLTITGLGGGISYHMSSDFDPTQVNFANPVELNPGLGVGLSGSIYTPDESVFLGFKAATMFNLASREEILNGTLILQMDFGNDPFGLQKVQMIGIAQMLAPLDLGLPVMPGQGAGGGAPPTTAMLEGYVDFTLTFGENPVFSGDIIAYLDSPTIYGGLPHKKIVEGDIYIAHDGWYINIGDPSQNRYCSAKVEFGPVNAEAKAYFNMGSLIPDMPALPDEVLEISDRITVNESFRKSGGGIMFGASFSTDAEIKIAGIASAEASFSVGFDNMLKKFNGAYCSDEGPGNPIGLGGWYAMGQMWAYAYGRLEVFGDPICELSAAAVLQMRGPNPTYVQGILAAKYVNRFDIEKTKEFEVVFGEDCELASDEPQEVGFDVIASVDPFSGTDGVEVDCEPLVRFNLTMEQHLEVPDINGNPVSMSSDLDHVNLKYAIKYYNADSTYTTDTIHIPLAYTWADDKKSLTISPSYFLPGNDTILYEVKVTTTLGADIIEETKTGYFVTNDGLSTIPASNIAYAYPERGMYNYYTHESTDNYIKLKKGQPDLIYGLEENEILQIKISDQGGNDSYYDVNYDPFNGGIIRYSIPETALNLATVYRLQLIKKNEHEGIEKVLTQLYFRTAHFETFGAKVDNMIDSYQQTPFTKNALISSQATIGKYEHENVHIEMRGTNSSYDWLENNIYSHKSKGIDWSGAVPSFEDPRDAFYFFGEFPSISSADFNVSVGGSSIMGGKGRNGSNKLIMAFNGAANGHRTRSMLNFTSQEYVQNLMNYVCQENNEPGSEEVNFVNCMNNSTNDLYSEIIYLQENEYPKFLGESTLYFKYYGPDGDLLSEQQLEVDFSQN